MQHTAPLTGLYALIYPKGDIMEKRNITITMTGVAAMLHNELPLFVPARPEKKRGQSYEDHEEAVWKFKAVTMDELPATGTAKQQEALQLAIKGDWVRRTLIDSQRRSAIPIKPPNARSKTETMMNFFGTGIIFDEKYPIVGKNGEHLLVKDTVPHRSMVRPTGKGRVLCLRPMILTPWTVTVVATVIDETVKVSMLQEALSHCGIFFGFGDWRPQNKGAFGRYTVDVK